VCRHLRSGRRARKPANVQPDARSARSWTFAPVMDVNVHPSRSGNRGWTFAATTAANVQPCRYSASGRTFADRVMAAGKAAAGPPGRPAAGNAAAGPPAVPDLTRGGQKRRVTRSSRLRLNASPGGLPELSADRG
jgi:hypothetical protein